MGILKKLTTLTRGAARESAEVLLDANAVRIFEQEIVDVESTIQRRKQSLGEMMLARKQVEVEITSIHDLVQKREKQAADLIDDDSQAVLVDSIASDILQYEAMLEDLQQQRETLSKRILKTENILRKSVSEVARYRRELRLVKSKQIKTSLLAKENNLPKQLSELEDTRQHVLALQNDDEDREVIWEEMENQVASQTPQSFDRQLYELEKQKKKEAILQRLKNKGR